MKLCYSQTLFRGKLINIGQFDCPRDASSFQNTGPIGGHLFAFPRTAVKIRHLQMKNAFVANPTITTLYNPGQEYERYPLSHYGDRCDWLSVCPNVILEHTKRLKCSSSNEMPTIPVAYTRCSSKAYRRLRQLVQYLTIQQNPEPLFVEETALTIINDILLSVQQDWGLTQRPNRSSTTSRHLQWVHATNELISTAFRENLSLDHIAQQVHCTPYHLSRIYKRYTGRTIHQHLSTLRLHHALELLEDPSSHLSHLGTSLGFSDHSHFSYKFRQSFGMTPSIYRCWSQSPSKYLS